MKVSVRWLSELVPGLPGDVAGAREIARLLTASGLEVEGTAIVGDFSGVVVGEVRGKARHPKADKLTLVDVWDGQAVTQVVCGAPNVPEPGPGAKVAWARPGARLPDGNGGHRVLEAREVRGVISPGMLCAEDELGLGASHAGIIHLPEDATPGTDVAALLGLPDTILELNVTPNRPDALGHLGVAREVAALFAIHHVDAVHAEADRVAAPLVARPPSELVEEGAPAAELTSVEIADTAGCPRYVARVLTGVNVGPSPLRVQLRLAALGSRSINNVVDATNLVLMETGQPLHAFDLDRLAGGRIVVRRAGEGEPIVTLDGQERRLCAEDVAICDAERPVAVAGVMGGRDSEVSSSTTRILLESAYFDPGRIRRTSRRLGLKSEASHRFERGADPNEGVELASRLCARRIVELAGGRIAPGAIDVYPRPIAPVTIDLRPSRTNLVLGVATTPAEQARVLSALGLGVTIGVRAGEGLTVGDGLVEPSPEHVAAEDVLLHCSIPTYRPDLVREIDLIEEIARVRGYDAVPATFPALRSAPWTGRTGRDGRAEAARDALVGSGFSEAITYAFVGPDRISALGFPEGDRRARPLRLSNPLREEQSTLRTSLLPGLFAAMQRNTAFGVADQRLFEVGMVFLRHGAPPAVASHLPPAGRDERLPEERRVVAGVLSGRRAGWLKPGEELDFFDVKGVVETLLAVLGVQSPELRAVRDGEAPWLHPGLGAALLVRGEATGFLGEVHPSVRDRFGVEERALAFEVDLEGVGAPAGAAASEIPRYPASTRDLSFFVERGVTAAELSAVMRGASDLLVRTSPLDDYREPGRVPEGQKGLLFALVYRSRDRTLTDEEVTREHGGVVEALRARFKIDPR